MSIGKATQPSATALISHLVRIPSVLNLGGIKQIPQPKLQLMIGDTNVNDQKRRAVDGQASFSL
jgi:hypothetical protein